MNHARLLLLSGLSLLLTGCGYTVESARETGAQKTCDYFVRCNQVGSGKAYATVQECLTSQRANFQTLWPSASCPSINAANLDVCLKGIDASACGSVLDIISTLTKCQAALVCQAPGDGG